MCLIHVVLFFLFFFFWPQVSIRNLNPVGHFWIDCSQYGNMLTAEELLYSCLPTISRCEEKQSLNTFCSQFNIEQRSGGDKRRKHERRTNAQQGAHCRVKCGTGLELALRKSDCITDCSTSKTALL